MKKMGKGLRRFFKRSDEQFTNVNGGLRGTHLQTEVLGSWFPGQHQGEIQVI